MPARPSIPPGPFVQKELVLVPFLLPPAKIGITFCLHRPWSKPNRWILLLVQASYFQLFLSACCLLYLLQFSSVAQSCPTLCDPMNRSTPGLPVHHQLPEFISLLSNILAARFSVFVLSVFAGMLVFILCWVCSTLPRLWWTGQSWPHPLEASHAIKHCTQNWSASMLSAIKEGAGCDQ